MSSGRRFVIFRVVCCGLWLLRTVGCMPKSKKRKTRSTGAAAQAKFRYAMMQNTVNTNPALVHKLLLEQFPWIGVLDSQDQKDCLDDLTIEMSKMSPTDRKDFDRAVSIWSEVAHRVQDQKESALSPDPDFGSSGEDR